MASLENMTTVGCQIFSVQIFILITRRLRHGSSVVVVSESDFRLPSRRTILKAVLRVQHRYPMPRAIISPSVLASDFGCLTAECNRMIKGGAEWLHMGTDVPLFPTIFRFLSVRFSHRCHGWVII